MKSNTPKIIDGCPVCGGRFVGLVKALARKRRPGVLPALRCERGHEVPIGNTQQNEREGHK